MAETTCAQCAECGRSFETRRLHQRFCTQLCQRREQSRRHRAEGRHLKWMRCDNCNKWFRGDSSIKQDDEHKRRYCSSICQAEAKRWTLRKVFSMPIPWADCEECGCRFVSHRGRSRCDACWIESPPVNTTWFCGYCRECGSPFVTKRRGPHLFCSRQCKTNAHRQRHMARKRAGFVERVFRRKVFERDAWICQLCNKPTSSKRWQPDDPLAPTIDHIIPLAKGGDHSYANTQCAHAICNSRKQDQIEAEQHQLRLAA